MPHMSPSLIHCYPLMVGRAAGCMVEDVDGNVYLDAEAGVATASTGHCHPAVAAAIAAQAETLIHICGTDFHYPGYGEICERLGQLAQRIGPNAHHWQTFLTNSGTEAVEASLKLARQHTKRPNIIAFRGGFHGRTMGSLSLTASKAKYRRGFGPLLPGVYHATYGEAASVAELFATTCPAEDVAAIVVEPVLGEGGYIVPPAEFLPGLRALCDRHGILLVFDEVQSGMGRTGQDVRRRAHGRGPGRAVAGQGHRLRNAAGRDDGPARGHDLGPGDARLDDRRQPGRHRRRDGDAGPAGKDAGRQLGARRGAAEGAARRAAGRRGHRDGGARHRPHDRGRIHVARHRRGGRPALLPPRPPGAGVRAEGDPDLAPAHLDGRTGRYDRRGVRARHRRRGGVRPSPHERPDPAASRPRLLHLDRPGGRHAAGDRRRRGGALRHRRRRPLVGPGQHDVERAAGTRPPAHEGGAGRGRRARPADDPVRRRSRTRCGPPSCWRR